MKSRVLVLLHGYPFDHTMWYGVIASLGSGLKVLVPDLPGFGQNPVSDQDPSLDAMADSVVKVLDQNEISKAVVAGMSMGGYVALAFAERHAQRLAGLGLVNTQAMADTEETRKARRNLIHRVRADGVAVAVQALLPKLFAPAKAQDPDYVRFPTEGAAKAGIAGVTWALEAMARRPDRAHVLAELQVPCMILHGTEDEIIPFERARKMAEINGRISLLPIRGVGHCSPIEAPEAVASGLRLLVDAVTIAEQK